MSNRLRVLFHAASDGQVAFTGRMALERMRLLIATPPLATTELNRKEWIKRGKPPALEKKMNWHAFGGPEVIYVVEEPQKPVTAPDGLKGLGLSVSAIKMLWKRLPVDVRKQSSLLVIREDRNNCWRQSPCNPRKYGWIMASKPSKASRAAPLPGSVEQSIVFGEPGIPDFWTPPSSPASFQKGFSMEAIKQAAQTQVNKYIKRAYISPQFEAAFEAPPKKKKKPTMGLSLNSGEGEGPASPGNTTPKAETPKLKLGIWS